MIAQRIVKPIRIGPRSVGDGEPVFIVAELSANHNHDIDIARKTIDAAAEAGADGIKLQTYTPDTITYPSTAGPFQITGGTAWDGRTLYDLYSEAYTPWEWHEVLFDHARDVGLIFFSSPFDPTAVDFLEALDVPAFKIASFEITDIPLIRNVARRRRPVIISTGIATRWEIDAAVTACREAGNDQIVLLKCTSAYPAPPEELNLRTMVDMKSRFGAQVGLSDHTVTHTAAIASVALGARMVEKHVIFDRALGGPDARFSIEPDELRTLVNRIREAEAGLGKVTYELTSSARISRKHARSLFVVADVDAGDTVTYENVRSIRPADGLPPSVFDKVLGCRFVTPVEAGSPLAWEMLE